MQKQLHSNTLVPLTRYYLVFAAATVLAIVLWVGLVAFDINLGSSSAPFTLIVAVAVTAPYFVSRTGRLPSKQESRRLVLGSFIANIVIGCTFLCLFVITDPTGALPEKVKEMWNELPRTVLVIILLFVAMVNYLLLMLFYATIFKVLSTSAILRKR